MSDQFFDLAQVRAYEAVCRTGSFTKAAEALGMAQSSISQHVQRLEARLQRALLRRHGRSIELTPMGEATLIYVRSMLAVADQARRHLSEPPLNGLIRLGLVEDFATAKLSSVLAVFRKQHPHFELTFETGLSAHLFGALDAGDLDVVVAKRMTGRKKGDLLWREPLVWVGHADVLGAGGSIPISTYPAPSETRDVILATLQAAGRPWTIVTQSAGLFGITAAVEAGLGIAAFGKHLIPKGLRELPPEADLPKLGELEYVVDHRSGPDDAALVAFIALLRDVSLQLMTYE